MEIVVRQGDSQWHYSQLFKINLSLIYASNPTIQPNSLSVGQKVKIPGFVLQDYQIRQGETLWKIA
ncbi:LysM repeat protein [Bacillus sp. SORGH_AS 510]|nr:LysM repeat protein [Bacillus sp. SORGH_AS_0510]